MPLGAVQPNNALANVLRGGSGDDTLHGLDGNDTLIGGAGDDSLFGGEGNDLMDGGTGADTMAGEAGNDAYFVDDAGDVVIELADEGNDVVRTTLLAYTLTDNVEALAYSGTGDFAGTGNALANAMVGGSGDDVLRGLAGNDALRGLDGDDILIGGAGRDTLTGGAGADTFVFDVLETAANADVIVDFAPGEDRIALSRAAFTGLSDYAIGALDPVALGFGTQATTADQRLIYDAARGALYYDADGVAGAAAILVATLYSAPGLGAGDLYLV